jgi:hypothetical protein
MSWSSLSPRQRMILLAVLGAGGLALMVMLSRRGAATSAAAPSAGDLGATAGIPGTTFADNGGQAAGLSADVTSALGNVSTDLENLPGLVGQAVAANMPAPTSGPLEQAPAGLSVADVVSLAAAFSPPAQASTPSGAPNSPVTVAASSAQRAPAPAGSVHTALQGADKGDKYKVEPELDKRGQRVGVWHVYSDHRTFVPNPNYKK